MIPYLPHQGVQSQLLPDLRQMEGHPDFPEPPSRYTHPTDIHPSAARKQFYPYIPFQNQGHWWHFPADQNPQQVPSVQPLLNRRTN